MKQSKDRHLLILIMGLPGTGKTTLATALAMSIGAYHYNSDMIRHHKGLRGKYDRPTKDIIYSELLHLAGEGLNFRDVVIDASFSELSWRKAFGDLEEKRNCRVCWIVMECNPMSVHERVSKKRRYSEADYAVYLKLKEKYPPQTEEHLVLQSDRMTVGEMVEKARIYLCKKSGP